jgi:hypothetical protein
MLQAEYFLFAFSHRIAYAYAKKGKNKEAKYQAEHERVRKWFEENKML